MSKSYFRGSVAVLVWRGEKLLAVSNKRFIGYSAPGGKIESGESPEEAAKRELLEEAGVEPISLRQMGGFHHQPHPDDPDRTPWACFAFEAEIGDQEPVAAEPGTDIIWASTTYMTNESLWSDWYKEFFDLHGVRY